MKTAIIDLIGATPLPPLQAELSIAQDGLSSISLQARCLAEDATGRHNHEALEGQLVGFSKALEELITEMWRGCSCTIIDSDNFVAEGVPPQ